MRLKPMVSLCSGVAAFAVIAAAASAATFTTPVRLVGTNSNGKPDPSSGPFGGEPSIAADRLGHVYVSSPEGIPQGLNGNPGDGFWISNNDGTRFSSGKYIGSYLGGGDSDVIVANTPKPNTVFNADLEAAATEICMSTNFGKTFTGVGPLPDPANCTTINAGQAGPSDDRQWLTYDPRGKELYLTYHEFVSAQPLAFRSDNGGAGNLDVIGAGFVNTPSNTARVWMFSSATHGRTWQKQPILLDPQRAKHAAYMLPAAIGGPLAGQLAVGYFRTTNGVINPNSSNGRWTYAAAESKNANRSTPTFTYGDVHRGTIYHSGQICNAGILCGAPGEPSDRSLLDFTSATLDPHGCPLFTFAGNTPKSEAAGQTWNYVTRQTSGCF